MDNSNWRPTQAEPSMDGVDWRTQLQPDSRHRIVNKIMETLKRHLPISGPEGINELKKIAVRFEEKIYSAATSQSDYLHRISVKMLTMETKSQNTGVPNSLPSNSTGNQKPPDSASIDSTAQTNHANVVDWQEEVYQKIKSMKEMYLPDLTELHQMITIKCQQTDSLPQPQKDQIEKLKMMKMMMDRIIAFLQVSKNNIPISFREKLGHYEKQIISVLNSNWPKKIISSQQQQLQQPGGHPLSMQQQPESQITQLPQNENPMNPRL